ncbi:2-C-methyl-D-erythritol 2,4-cyclodiphosphate synthase [Candidatus Microgenomates bacterium]|nr:2-C-methyl-D-erythritol 2,4-cyclodiphosphate synthase [Candidatus Microgenomates bacterium]
MFRIGIGLDSHRIKLKTPRRAGSASGGKNKKNLILGGVEVSKDYYALADSDGDIIIHSLCNALSTAIGGGSLDTWAGPMFKKGITDSQEFLKVIFQKVKNQGFKVGNVAIMLEGQNPKLEKYQEKMQKSLAKLLEIKKEDIGIAFTTGQDLTVFGKGKGIQVFSTVLLFK